MGQADTLREAGFRFAYRHPWGWCWMHPSDLTGKEIDATDMSDDEFEEAVKGTETANDPNGA